MATLLVPAAFALAGLSVSSDAIAPRWPEHRGGVLLQMADVKTKLRTKARTGTDDDSVRPVNNGTAPKTQPQLQLPDKPVLPLTARPSTGDGSARPLNPKIPPPR